MSFIDKVKYLFGVKPKVKPTHDARMKLPERMPSPPAQLSREFTQPRRSNYVPPAPVRSNHASAPSDDLSRFYMMNQLSVPHHDRDIGCDSRNDSPSYDSSSSGDSCSTSSSD